MPLQPGDKVRYVRRDGSKQKGIVKLPNGGDYVFVVFYCNNEWENYMNYTGQSTKISDLQLGWED